MYSSTFISGYCFRNLWSLSGYFKQRNWPTSIWQESSAKLTDGNRISCSIDWVVITYVKICLKSIKSFKIGIYIIFFSWYTLIIFIILFYVCVRMHIYKSQAHAFMHTYTKVINLLRGGMQLCTRAS